MILPKPAKRTRNRKDPTRKGKRTSRRRKARKAREKDCDRVFSLLIRTRDDWQCKKCGKQQMPQCAHIISRRYRATRWCEDNALCLCSRCHVFYTHRPLEWDEWIEERYPGRLPGLRTRALAGVHGIDYDELLASLQSQLEAVEARRKG